MQTRILFVDDDKFLLAALRRLVWNFSEEWDCEFSVGGVNALELLAAEPFDVVVSDMRMPEMSGSELLEIVRETWPDTIRFILSGQSDSEYSFQAISSWQQFLAKPCGADELKAAVSGAIKLRDLLCGDELTAFLDSVPALQSPPGGCSTETSDATKSLVERLGAPDDADERLQPFTFAASVFATFEDQGSNGAVRDSLLQHAAASGALAEQIVISATGNREAADHAALAGVLQNLGEIVGDRYPEAGKLDHALLGAALLHRWGLPIAVVEAVGGHHDPECMTQSETRAEMSPLIAVLASNLIVAEAPEPAIEEYLSANGFGADRLEAWRQLADQMFSAI